MIKNGYSLFWILFVGMLISLAACQASEPNMSKDEFKIVVNSHANDLVRLGEVLDSSALKEWPFVASYRIKPHAFVFICSDSVNQVTDLNSVRSALEYARLSYNLVRVQRREKENFYRIVLRYKVAMEEGQSPLILLMRKQEQVPELVIGNDSTALDTSLPVNKREKFLEEKRIIKIADGIWLSI